MAVRLPPYLLGNVLERLVSKLVRNTLSNFGLNILTVILGFVALPILIEAIGDDGYGLLKLVGTVMGYFGILGAGVPAGTVKYVAEFDAKDDQPGLFKIINTSFGFFLAVGFVAAGVIVTFGSLGGLSFFEISEENLATARQLLFIAAGFALVSWPATVLSNTLEGLQEHHTKNVIEAVSNVLRYGGSIAVALAGWGIMAVFLAQQASYVVRWVWLTIAVKRRLPDWNPNPFHFDTRTFKLIASFSVWLLMTQIAVLLNYQTDHIILGAFLPIASLTIYEIVTRPFAIIRKVSSLFNSAIMPAVSATDAGEKSEEGINIFAYTGGRYNNAFVAPLAVIGIFLSGPFIGLWVGEKYLEYAWIAQVSCAFQLVWQSNSLLGRVFYGTGKVRRLAWLAIIMAVVNASLSVVLVQYWGLAGVVMATIFAGAIGPPLQYLWVFPVLDIDRGRYFVHSVLRAQIPHLLIAGGLMFFWQHFEAINTWWSLVAHLVVMLITLLTISWFWSVDSEHREWVLQRARNALGKLTGRS